MKAFSRFCSIVEKIVDIVLVIAFAAIIGIMVYQAVMRYVFNHAPTWAEELTIYICCYSTLLGAAIAVRRGLHLQVDFLLRLFKPNVQVIISAVVSVVMVVFFVVFAKYSISLCQYATGKSVTMPFITIKQIYYSFPLGSALIILFSIENFLKDIQKLRQSGTDGEKEAIES